MKESIYKSYDELLPQPRGRLPTPSRQSQRDAGADPGGDPAAADPGQRGRLL